MASVISLRVLTQEGLVVADEALSVTAPGEPGYLGMLRNHAPLVTTLKPGTLIWRRSGKDTRTLRIGRGLLEVEHNRITVLTDAVSAPG